MAKKRVEKFRPAKSYDDAFEAFNDINNNVPTYGFASLGNQAASTFRGFDTGFGRSSYDENLSWNADINEEDVQGSINEYRSNQQGGWDETGAFFGRVGAKVVTEAVKTIAAIGGTVAGIAGNTVDLVTGEDNTDFLETAFNNDFVKAAEKIQKYVQDEYLPVYVSDTVTNGNFLDKVTAGEFWATEGADGVGYLISAMAPGAAFKALGGANKIFGGMTKATALRYGKSIEVARKALTKAGMTTDKINDYMIPAFNTYFEAGAEAKGAGDAADSRKPEFIEKFKSKLDINSREFQIKALEKGKEFDDKLERGEISIDEYNELGLQLPEIVANELAESAFLEQKGRAMRNVFLTNIGILALPNYIQAKLVFGKTPSKVLLDKIGGLADKSVKNTIGQGLKRTGKAFLSEGSEEVGQTSTEHRNVDRAINNELEEFYLTQSQRSVEDIGTFGVDFIKSLGTTEGQVAGFLGGILGSPISVGGGYMQDVRDRKQTEKLREKINGASTAYSDIRNTIIYEQEEYTNPETGEVSTRDKEIDGKKILIPEAVAKVKKALDLVEKDSNEYDNAVEDGDVEKIEQFRNRGELNIINDFIGEDEVTLDALHEHLKVAFPTENSKDISDEQVKINKTNLERIDKIMKKAKHLQKDLVSFKDMSTSILRINHPDITENSTKEEKKAANEHLADFLNRVSSTFISERAEEYEAKQVLNKLEKQKLDLENSATVIEIDNPNYIEGVSHEFDKKVKTRSNNPRLELIYNLIDNVNKKLKVYEENTNSNIWNNELLNKQFAKEVEERKQIKKENSPEQVAKNDAIITAAKNATTEEEVTDIEKNAPPEVIANPVIKNQIDTVKEALAKAKRRETEGQIADATQEDSDFNDTTIYSDLIGTEGSSVTDELIPTNSENNTAEEVKDVENETETIGKGAQVISTYRRDDEKGRWKAGDIIDFIKEKFNNFIKYEKEPVDKTGRPVTFEINTNPGPDVKINEALALYNTLLKRGFNTMTDAEYNLLYDYLPINARFTPDVNAPIGTKKRIKDKKTGEWVDDMNISTGLLRTQLIANLRNGISIENMSTTIQSQYKGFLKVDDNRFANNNILELDGVPNLKYVRDNLYVVDSFGNLKNIQTGKTKPFINDKVKKNAAGEIYLEIPQANGKPFPLKLNIKKLDGNKSYTLASIYSYILKIKGSSNMTLSEVKDEQLIKDINEHLGQELKVIIPEGKSTNDVKLGEIIDLLVYESDNIKSRINITNDVLYYGDKEANSENIDDVIMEVAYFLNQNKRHQIKISPKFATDNTKTNLQSNSADYLKYLIDNNILSTNAVVGKDKDGNNIPTFQGYTNIYLNTGVTINNEVQLTQTNTKFDIEAKKADIERRRQEELDILSVADVEDLFLKRGIISKPIGEDFGTQQSMLNAYWNLVDKKHNKGILSLGSVGQVLKTGRYIDANLRQAFINLVEDEYTLHKLFEKIDKGWKMEGMTPNYSIDKINAKYDAELEALNQPKVSESGVEADNNDFEGLDFDDKQTVTQPITGLQITYTPIGKQSQTYTVNKNKILNSKGEEVFKEDSADRRKIFANVAVKEGRAKVIEDNKGVKYVVNNKQQIMSTATGKIMEWDENHSDRKFLIGVYNSLKQPKVSEEGVQISADDMGLGDVFETEPKVENKVLDKIKSFTKTEQGNAFENNPNIIRNSQESFVSLSEIPGTMENTKLNKTQIEVFNETKTSLLKDAVRMAPIIEKYKESLKKGGQPLSVRDQARLNKWAEENPEAYKKIC